MTPAGDGGFSAKIIRALGRGAHRFLAVYRERRSGGVAEPVEKRARQVFEIARADAGEAKDGDLVWIEAKNPRARGPTRARVRAVAGHIDDRHSYSLIAVASHGIPIEFPAAALQEAARAKHPPLGKRVDLRDAPLLTIDPEDARDHDDAVCAAPDEDPANAGGFKVVVAIADVGAFVEPGGALDREAERRGNSVYLPDRVVPMLPERLSNDLCSLKPGVDRPCLFVEMTLDAKGRKLSHRFDRGIMRSAAKLAYRDAQDIIDGKDAPSPVKETVLALHAAFKARMAERRHRAPMDLDLVERRVVLDPEGRVARVEKRERFDAHRLIEEFMILANIAAAETLEQKKMRLIYRVHDTPDPERLKTLRDYLDGLGYSLINSPAIRPQHFNEILKKAEERGEKEMISDVVLRSQRQAVYATENLGHFGLNLARYAHFTSPIRRYADLTVHRALVSALKLGPGGQSEDEAARLSKIAEKISDCERRAMTA
ncbi:MAG: VacB/RNase II family 3'-5' exoribonuclease, partial [Parvularculaceae bacterium]|nr:VacB/RNase II family 3'-5' exoribonuclease [Parvularculaceae bacterium]